MSVVYDGQHSVIFYDALASDTSSTPIYYKSRKQSWLDFHLVPTKRLSIATPAPLITMISIPGTSRRVDMTDLMPGGLKFGRRQGEWEFIIDHDKWTDWNTAKKEIEDYLNGKRLYCVLDDDYNTAYVGRFKVQNWQSGSDYSSVSIFYDLEYDTYLNVFNVVRDVSEHKSLYTWMDIDEMIRDGSYRTKLQVGDKCQLVLPGDYDDYAEIAGIDMDEDDSGNVIPITWVCRLLLDTKHQMILSSNNDSTTTDYRNTDLRNYLNNSFGMQPGYSGLIDMFPDRLKHMLRKAKKTTYLYRSGSSSGETVSHYDYVWIPSYREVTGNTTAKETSGPIYSDYFSSNKALYRMPKHYDERYPYNYAYWFLRTSWDADYYMLVHTFTSGSGGEVSHLYTNYRIQPTKYEGVLPCFCTGVAT